MSLLTPLYVLGALGIGLPILFHLIKRQPRGQRLFSSLMFLKPTPPTVTRRSRIDNLPLLLLRALALLLLAAAFARPYFRSSAQMSEVTPGKRFVLLLDTSASMRRTGLWDQAQRQANDFIASLGVADQLAIVSFDSKPKSEFAFEQAGALELVSRREGAKQAIERLKPTWDSSDLASALIFAADLLTNHESQSPQADSTPRAPHEQTGSIILISDMQAGSEANLKGLQSYSWPKGITTEVIAVSTPQKSNASAMVLASDDRESTPANDQVTDRDKNDDNVAQPKTRVRVLNSLESAKTDFTVLWYTAAGSPIESTRIPVHVGPGESRIIRMPEPPSTTIKSSRLRLVLEGDDHDFDNAFHVSRAKPLEQQILFVGSDTTEPRDSLCYYLQRAPLDNRRRVVNVVTIKKNEALPELAPKRIPLIIVAESPSEDNVAKLKQFISRGGRLVWVLDTGSDLVAAQRALRTIGQASDLSLSEAMVKDYTMWSRIDFKHPLFAPFADPRYNDFTKIRFWSHRKIQGLDENWKTMVNFDDGDVAITQKTIDQGQLWILTAGWQPRDSQLALSTKFVPLLDGFLRVGRDQNVAPEQHIVGGTLPFAPSSTARLESESQPAVEYRTVDDAAAVDRPGFYRFVDGESAYEFALNLSPSESITQPLGSDELERYGVRLASRNDSRLAAAVQRQQKDVELEGRQRLWRWILLGVLALIGAESALSGYLRRRSVTVS